MAEHRAVLPLLPAFFCLLAWALPAVGQAPSSATTTAGEVRLTITTDRDHLLVDDRLSLVVRVEGPPDLAVDFPDPAGRLTDWTLLERRRTDGPADGAPTAALWEEIYLLQPETVGDLALPELAIGYRTRTQPAHAELAAAPLTVTVGSVLPAGADLADLRGPAPPVEIMTRRPWAELAGIAAILLLAGLLLWRRQSRSAAGDDAGLAASSPTPIEQLDELERAGLVASGRMAELYAGLSHLLREHILQRTAVTAQARTTPELREVLDRPGRPLFEQRAALGDLLEACDRVRYARHRPSADEARTAMAQARTLLVEGPPAALPVGAAPAEQSLATRKTEIADPA